ncbi:MAG: CBS domain-containing protein [Solirubrobacteraceae bacterium]
MTLSETPLARISVADATHTGILTTDPDTPLTVVARLMAARRVHVVAVAGEGEARRPLTIVSALDVATAVAAGAELTAGQAAQTELEAVLADRPLEEAARLMAEHRVEHLAVIDPASGHVEGILSALDVAAVFGR